MSKHGGGPIRLRNHKPLDEPVITVAATAEPNGYRHYDLKGQTKPTAPTNRKVLAEQAARLELRMTAPMNWTPAPPDLPEAVDFIAKPKPDPLDNPYIPSGYTYFAQFVAHDMVSTRLPFWAANNLETDTANDRATRLRLDGLYGNGPDDLPIIYVPADDGDLSRGKLQIGRAASVPVPGGTTVCPFRDIARLKLAGTLHDLPGLTEPLVADQRNDDHAIISQLTMVFSHLHNIFIDRQKPVNADDPTFSFTHDTARLFSKARDATTLIYRHLVREDLLKRILHPAVYRLYAAGRGKLLDRQAGDRNAGLPLEFSHAAFRFGHAMVRESYHINTLAQPSERFLKDGLERFSSGRNVHMAPMAASWLIQWSNFFNIPGRTDPARINLSRRIGPRCPLSLFGTELGAIDASAGRGIMYRDLISAELADLWNVGDLLEAMRAEPDLAAIINGSSLLQGTNWRDAIAAWLPLGVFAGGSAGPWDGMTPEAKQADIASIAANPPLPFFVLFEASLDADSHGCRLGPFGSILVAETLFAELNNSVPAERQSAVLSEQLKWLDPSFTDSAFNGPATLACVIDFVDRCLQANTDPAMKFPSLL